MNCEQFAPSCVTFVYFKGARAERARVGAWKMSIEKIEYRGMLKFFIGMIAMVSVFRAAYAQEVDDGHKKTEATNVFARWKGSWVTSDLTNRYCVSTNPDLIGVAFVWDAPVKHRMRGRVVGPDNEPVGAAYVFARASCHGIPICEEANVDPSGNFEIDLPLDPSDESLQWTLRASKGMLAGELAVDGSIGRSDLVISLSTGRTVSIRLHEQETGKPIDEFFIFFRGSRLYRSHGGVCIVEGLPAENRSTIFAPVARGRASYRYNLDLAGDLPTELDLPVARGGVVRGVVKDSEGRPAPFRPVSMLNMVSASAMTNEKGEFSLVGVPCNRPVFVHVGMTFQSSGKTWTINKTPVELGVELETSIECQVPTQMYTSNEQAQNAMMAALIAKDRPARQKGAVFGKVTKPDGSVCEQFSVRLSRSSNRSVPQSDINYLYEESGAGVSFGNKDGQFMITQVDAETYVDIHVSADGYSDAVFRDVLVPSIERSQSVPLTAELYETIQRSFVFTDEEGNPSVGKQVFLCRGVFNSITELDRIWVVASAVTDENGNAEFAGVPMDEGVLVVRSGNGQDQYFGFDSSRDSFKVETPREVRLAVSTEEDLDGIEINLRPKSSFRSSDSVNGKLTNGECKFALLKAVYSVIVSYKPKHAEGDSERKVLYFDDGKPEWILDLTKMEDLDIAVNLKMKLKPTDNK